MEGISRLAVRLSFSAADSAVTPEEAKADKEATPASLVSRSAGIASQAKAAPPSRSNLLLLWSGAASLKPAGGYPNC